MKMFQKLLTVSILTILLLPFLALAASPGIPHKFYGTVSFTSGTTPNGLLVEAKINSIVAGSSVTGDGKYGYNPDLLFATDPQNTNAGKPVEFYVSGIKAAQAAIFVNGESTNLNLTVPGTVGNITKNEGEVIANEEVVVTPQSLTSIHLGTNLSITISSATNTNATVEKIEKKSSGNVAVFSGKNFLNAYEIKISGGSLNISVTMKYDDTGIDEDTIKPYRFNGTSWVAITPFTIDKTANTITFTISSGQTVYGIFGSTAQAAPSGGGGGGGGGGGESAAVTYKTGDTNKDGKVDKYDFALLMANWGKLGTNASDLNNDDKVDKYDFALLMLNWNK